MEELEILNGIMSPKYDQNNNLYTVNISEDINSLDLKYNLLENKTINVYGNLDFEIGQNKVVLAISENDKVDYITLMVNKKKDTSASSLINTTDTLSINKNDLPIYVAPLIASICFIVVLFIFFILFHKKGKKS